MRDSFIFYNSFLDALDELDADTRLKVYDAITHYAIKDEEPELTGIAKAIFSLIKPQIDANNKRYEDGKKGAGFGKLGGRPKKEKTLKNPIGVISENPKETPNVNVNDNVNVNVNDNVLLISKKSDPFISPLKEKFKSEYKKVFGSEPYLSRADCERLLELSLGDDDFESNIPVAFEKLKDITFNFKDRTVKPKITWLLKDNHFSEVVNDEYKKEENTNWLEEVLNSG